MVSEPSLATSFGPSPATAETVAAARASDATAVCQVMRSRKVTPEAGLLSVLVFMFANSILISVVRNSAYTANSENPIRKGQQKTEECRRVRERTWHSTSAWLEP